MKRHKIIEIDGPKVAFFEYNIDHAEGGGKYDREIYTTLAVVGYIPHDLVAAMNDILGRVRELIHYHPNPIIYWRTRPELRQCEGRDSYTIRCRLATYPHLTEEQLEDCMAVLPCS